MPSIRAPHRPAVAVAAMASPVGRLTLAATERGLAAVLWETDGPRRVPLGTMTERPDHPALRDAASQIDAYFAGTRRAFDLPLDLHGTEFQRRVWAELLLIPFGETRSYGQLARALGDPNLMRAVGAATDEPDHPVLREAASQIGAYFAGARRAFDLPLDWHGTAFQGRVWAELLLIPFGETRSYGQIARALGDPKLMRAVGAANGRNPLSIVAPCHRVVGAAGQLTGFAGGLAAKRFLLGLEGAGPGPDLFGGPVSA